jgi:hypothetical protein
MSNKADISENTKQGVDPVEPDQDDILNDHEARGHLNTILEAEMIKQDPVKMQKVHKLAGRHMKAITSLKDVKDVYQAKFGPKSKKTV